ncbi:MAG TPA: protein kinase [Pyrinomonadaceae bacterium]|nr:protein kinase [Pyrinomonadaceae bacterium]
MTPERYRQVGELYHAVLQVDPLQRADFLAQACAADPELKSEVESLLASHDQASDFIAAPALAVAAEMLAQDQNDELIGQTVAHYRIISLLGAGGMGRVFLAEDTDLGRRVALKFLPEYFTSNKSQVRRFQQEARSASALNHPNILTVYEVGQIAGTEYMATEYVEGLTLRSRLKAGGLSVHEALDVAVQIADALVAAHQAGIVHRDIKPENIMIRRDGYVKVLDFGLAKLSEHLAGVLPESANVFPNPPIVTNPGMVMGTAEYMSPEQTRALPVDGRTDIWSLGVVLYEMASGRRPFAAKTHGDIIVSILEKEPISLARQSQEVPDELVRIVDKALKKDLQARYQTIREMANDLRQLKRRLEFNSEFKRAVPDSTNELARRFNSFREQGAAAVTVAQAGTRISGGRGVAVSTSSLEYFVSEIQKHRRGAAFFGSVLIIFLGGLLYSVYLIANRSSIPAAPFATGRMIKLTNSGRAQVAAVSPDGKYVVYAEEEDRQQGLWIKQIGTGSTVQIVPAANVGYWGLTFSNDSNYVYYVRAERSVGSNNNLYQVPSLGGYSTKMLEQVDSAVAFSPDGRRFAFVRDNLKEEESLIVLANADGSGEHTLAMRKASHRFASDVGARVAWSPDGKIIACAAGGADATEVIGVSVEDGSEKILSSRKWRQLGQVAWLTDGSGLAIIATEQGSSQIPPQIWRLSYPSGEARRITNDLNRYRDLTITADSSALVTIQTNEISNIWVAPHEASNRARQITAGTIDTSLAWTPNGQIVYWSNVAGTRDIWIMNADGSNKKRLTYEGDNGRPRVSADGRYLVFGSRRADKSNIWRMDINGDNQTQLTYGTRNANPDISPDGRWVVYTSWDYGNGTIWKVPVDGGNPTQISGPTANLAVVSPDGNRIACFYWDEQANPPRGAMIFPFDGGPPIARFNIGPHAGGGFALQWASDGRALLYISNLSNIWSQPVNGGRPLQLTDFQGDQIFDFEYSRDGKWLAVARGRVTDDVVLISESR